MVRTGLRRPGTKKAPGIASRGFLRPLARQDLLLRYAYAVRPGACPKKKYQTYATVAALTMAGLYSEAARAASIQPMPSFCRPSSEIMCGVQGGSQTTRTLASFTSGIERSLSSASPAIAAPMPQPCAVSVIFTSTR